jgi:uncharacterized membrane protein YdbT with pleckstrin-like domain
LTLGIKPIFALYTSEFAVASRRIFVKTGFIAVRTFEMNPKQVESAHVNQTVLSRLLGYGTIAIKGAGGAVEMFHNVGRPLKFLEEIQKLL